MSRRATCDMCGRRFDDQRDDRRWKADATPVGGDARAKKLIVCTECFLELAEAEYGA